MNSSERILNTIRGIEADRVPFTISWNETQRLHGMLSWKNERERVEYAARMGWDTHVRMNSTVTPIGVSVKQTVGVKNGKRIMTQLWETPSATLVEELNFTENWDESELRGAYLGFESDFRTTRYIEYPFKNESDLNALRHIFPPDNPYDTEQLIESYKIKRALADEFGYPLFLYLDSGMDWLFWFYPLEEAVCRAIDEPEYIFKILGAINGAKKKRLELLLSLGVDGVIRRGWYECTDMWSPHLLNKFAWPAIAEEVRMTHEAGKVFVYTLDTGAKAIAADVAALGIDCVLGLDPVRGDMTVREIRDALPDVTLWGGLSGPGHFGADSPETAARAVEEAMSVYGKKRLILGMAASYRHYYPWENYLAAEEAWKRLR